MIPVWLADRAAAAGPPVSAGAGKQAFLEKTIRSCSTLLAETFINGDMAERAGFLQRLDPRCKLLGFLALIVTVSLLRSPWAIWGGYLFSILLAKTSRLGVVFLLKRVWLSIALFAAALAVPTLFNVVTPGEPLWVLMDLGKARVVGPFHLPAELVITRQGVLVAAVFVGRVATSLTLALLLTLTTPWARLMEALQVLKVPQTVIVTLTMTYRYLTLLVRSVAELHLARKSRTLRYGSTREEQRWAASRIGFLFGKAYRLSQQLYFAMLARGFGGEPKMLHPLRAKGRDVAWLLLSIMLCIIGLFIDRRLLHG
jgi:cobalt/nickel transport system permease protein